MHAGSIYAFSNAAMMAMQLGDEAGALRELQVCAAAVLLDSHLSGIRLLSYL